MCLIRCSTGIFIASGMSAYSRRCTRRTKKVDLTPTQPCTGTKARLGSLITTVSQAKSDRKAPVLCVYIVLTKCPFHDCLTVVPLAKKLKECGVFGVASDEYLTYALENRREWENRGKAIVNDMVEKLTSAVEDNQEWEAPGKVLVENHRLEREAPGKAIVNHMVKKVNSALANMADEISE
jgi:hypothetical protein